jgi:hypothetical protein
MLFDESQNSTQLHSIFNMVCGRGGKMTLNMTLDGYHSGGGKKAVSLPV